MTTLRRLVEKTQLGRLVLQRIIKFTSNKEEF